MVVKVQQSFLTETVICMLKIFQSQQSFLTETAICMLNDGGKLWVAVLFLESLACHFFLSFPVIFERPWQRDVTTSPHTKVIFS